MRYFFILGSNPTLSIAELSAVFNYREFSLIQKNIAILKCDYEIKADVIKKIGGTIKFGLICDELDSYNIKNLLNSIAVFAKPEKDIKTKFKFGISYYGSFKINIKVLGMEYKKSLKQLGLNSRWVISKEPTLSSVVVEQNKLVSEQGVEIVIIQFNKKLFLGKTLAVQPFKELSFRDYNRPARDDRSGMLPPKLAQIMINLSGANKEKTILDPFCGSGTIITEAMLMGYKKIIGADISKKAIEDTEKNIEWTKKIFPRSCVQDKQFSIFLEAAFRTSNFQLININSTQISVRLPLNSVDEIITEPYLGPQRGNIDINKIIAELEKLYSESLREFNKILKSTGRIVMIWPVFCEKQKNIFLNLDLIGFKIINPMPENLQKNIFVKLTNRNTIIYGREQQKIWREIVVLKKY